MKRKMLAVLFAVGILASLPLSNKVQAATNTKEMEAKKTYKVDLDGDGKKESLKYVIKETRSNEYLQIFINGKKNTDVNYNIKNKKLVKQNQCTYDMSQYWKSQKFILLKDISLYEDSSLTPEPSINVIKGTAFYMNRVYCKSFEDIPVVEIMMEDGKAGWLKIPDDDFSDEMYGLEEDLNNED